MERDRATTEERIVKVPFPVPLIRRMDEAIVAGRGGFQSRAELMREAVENLLNELDYPDAPSEPAQVRSAVAAAPSSADAGAGTTFDEFLRDLPSWERDELAVADLAATALTALDQTPHLITHGRVSAKDEPLLGLHNRDYVSLWALHRLARYTGEGPIGFEEYLRRVTDAAWYFGAQLAAIERADGGRKLTVLFPTNAAKRPSAERGFQSFAIGSLTRPTSAGVLPATGPLFVWQAIQVGEGEEMPTGLTEDGWRLLRDLDGLSLDLPHPPELTTRFLAFLKQHAPGDRWGFDYLVQSVVESPDREGLIASFRDSFPHWSPSTASSIVQGYVARGREWGLVEPRLVDGRYWLTDTGREHLKTLD